MGISVATSLLTRSEALIYELEKQSLLLNSVALND